MTEELMKEVFEREAFTVITADAFLKRQRNCFDTGVFLVITQVTAENEREVKEKIEEYFGDVNTEKKNGYVTVEPKPLFDKTRFGYGDLIEIVKRLRDPDGCPWDRKQSPETIRTNILEEAYELVEAIETGKEEKIREECGDVLLQSVFCSVMTEEKGSVKNTDVITDLCKKLIGRHTHIFGKDKATDAESALYYWEKAKAKEKGQKTVCDKLDVVPKPFTALQKANKVQKIIAKTGFEFPNDEEAVAKIYEEVKEFLEADEKDKEKEGGDILFSAVNVLRRYGVDPEVALNGTTNKFEKRFRYVVQKAEESGRKIEELSLEEMDKLYNESKKFTE